MKLRIRESGGVYTLQKKWWLGWSPVGNVVDYHGQLAVEKPFKWNSIDDVLDFIAIRYANKKVEIVD